MGWNIVRRMHPDEPRRHSRLWIKEEIEDILVNESGTEATRSIKLKYRALRVDEVNQYLPDALQSLIWRGYPFRSLPKTFQANKLVNLEMVGSNIFELWEGGERKLRFLDLKYSKLRAFDIGMTPNLETLDLRGCNDFVDFQMSAECRKLRFLNISGSKSTRAVT